MAEQAAEQLQQLTVSDNQHEEAQADSTNAEVAVNTADNEPTETAAQYKPTPEDHEKVDLAIRQALADPRERQTVLSLEAQVVAFIEDQAQDVLEFPQHLTNYQRMLAHRVGQHFGLATMSQDYNPHGGPGRVLARKEKRNPPTKMKYKFADLDVSNLQGRTYSRPNSALGDAAPKVMMKRPGMEGHAHYSRHVVAADALGEAGHPAKSAQEKEQEYYQARERLLGKGQAFEPAAPQPYGRGRGRFPGGRGGFVPYGGNGMGPMGGAGMYAGPPPAAAAAVAAEDYAGRGRKALYKDRDKDHHDPDYRRGVSRYPGMTFDPNFQPPAAVGGIYNTPTYGTEFPALKRVGSSASTASARSFKPDNYSWSSGSPSFRPGSAPQPPPPPGATQALPGTPTQKAGSFQAASPAQHSMQMAARPMAGYAMSPYPMQAVGMMPGMHPQAAMYAAHAGAALPYHMAAAGYGYMPHMAGEMAMAHPAAAAYGMYGYAGYPTTMTPGYAMPHAGLQGQAMAYAAAAGGYEGGSYGHGDKHGYGYGGSKGHHSSQYNKGSASHKHTAAAGAGGGAGAGGSGGTGASASTSAGAAAGAASSSAATSTAAAAATTATAAAVTSKPSGTQAAAAAADS